MWEALFNFQIVERNKIKFEKQEVASQTKIIWRRSYSGISEHYAIWAVYCKSDSDMLIIFA